MPKTPQKKKKWSADVTAKSDALDLEPNVFENEGAEQVARSLKRSAEASDRRKSSAFRSAMSMLTFYIISRRPKPALRAQANPRGREGKVASLVWTQFIAPLRMQDHHDFQLNFQVPRGARLSPEWLPESPLAPAGRLLPRRL